MRINVNTSAVNTHRIMTQNSQRQDKNLERLASGLKINRGADGHNQLVWGRPLTIRKMRFQCFKRLKPLWMKFPVPW